MIAGENQHVVRLIPLDKRNVLIDGIGRALVPFGLLAPRIGRKHLHPAVAAVQAPGLAVADIFVQFQRLILCQNSDGIDAGVDAIGEWKIDDTVFPAKGNGGLGGILRQHHQAAALAAGEKHCNAVFFLEVHALVSFLRFLGVTFLR